MMQSKQKSSHDRQGIKTGLGDAYEENGADSASNTHKLNMATFQASVRIIFTVSLR